ncbi:MAG TPA: DNA repair protein RadC [Steroidobacteraceae bacterium]|nr:DNA repair protein RadC [Dehalococcoidia bacterium]HYM29315.1 DNA repair protein RadC [Steroidobacteraceae bacterium]
MDGEDDSGRASYTLIRDLPATERPRERLRGAGAGALSTSELLAILLRTGNAKESALAQATRLLARMGGLQGLRAAPFMELCAQHGIGEAKAAQIKAALELGLRLASTAPDERAHMRTPEDIAGLVLAEMSALDQEQVRIMLLDSRNRLLALPTVYVGSVHTTNVRIAELLSDAVRVKAAAIVAIHNHPSGDPTPSAADVKMTTSLGQAAKLMDIDLLDHMVIGGGRYVSMQQLRLGFGSGAGAV